jgi:hypothetical protein
MATQAQAQRDAAGRTGKRRRADTADPERLKILQLDFQTITEQIRLLDSEMEQDPCLSAEALGTVLSLLDTLKQQLAQVRGDIRVLTGAAR